MGRSDESSRRITRAVSETDLREPVVPKMRTVKRNDGILSGISVQEEEEVVEKEEAGIQWWRTASLGVEEECGIGGGGGGKICGGGGGGGSEDDSTDLYYQKMIEANPGNLLLLSNYARFLKEVTRNLFSFLYKMKVNRVLSLI